MHFHVCVVDGVFEVVQGEVDADAKATPPGIIFHPASGIDEAGVAQVQADVRRRAPRAFVGRGLIERVDAKEMLAYQHSGFSVDAGVCIEAHDRAGLERLLRYCARRTGTELATEGKRDGPGTGSTCATGIGADRANRRERGRGA